MTRSPIVLVRLRSTLLQVGAPLLVMIAIAACDTGGGKAPTRALGEEGASPSRFTTRVVETYPHDRSAFTQGLEWAGNGQLFESTGRRGSSTLRRVDLATGGVLELHELADEYFAEGLAQVDNRLIQLTWQENTAFVYDASSFDVEQTFDYDGEGWGLCFDGRRLVMSDGTETLTFRDPDTFEALGTVTVTNDGRLVSELNELECVGDRVLANVFGEDRIVEIDPQDGSVTAEIDASNLDPDRSKARGEVLNGIAYDPDSGRYYLTGKNWPSLYEVVFEPV